jgi:photosystem II stability/assembly factor-like uncharacterized protein
MLAALVFAAVLHAPHDPVNCWAISPDFGQDRTIFVGQNAFGMLLRSRDGGQSWQTIQAGLDTAYVHALAISPDYVADGTLYAAEAGGLFRTSNAGDQWERVQGLPDGTGVTTIAFSPDHANDRTIALGTGTGMLFSRDGGASWTGTTLPGKGAVNAIVFEDGYAGTGYVLALRGGATAALSRNGGRDFDELALPPGARVTSALLGSGFGLRGAMTLACGAQGVWASDDFGESWEPDATGLPAGDEALHLSSTRNAQGRVVQFVSLARGGVYRRMNGGAWEGGRAGMRALSDQSKQHHFAAQATGDFATEPIVYAATFEGLHVSRDGAESWAHLPVLPTRFTRNVVLAAGRAGAGDLLVASYGEGLLLGSEGGTRWETLDTGRWAFPDGIALSPDWPDDPSLLVGTPSALLLSRDGGKTFTNCHPGAPGFLHVGAFAPDFADTGTIYAHTLEFGNEAANDFLRSDDRGKSWTRTGPRTIHDLAFAPDFAQSGRMYVATPGNVSVSHDRGRSWSALGGLPTAMMYGVAATAGPRGDRLLAVSPMAGVYASEDGGASWTSADDGLDGARATAAAYSPDHETDGSSFLLTQSQGVFARGPGETRWRSRGLAGEYALRMSISPDFAHDRTLAVAAYAGVFISRDAGETWSLLDPVANLVRRPVTEPDLTRPARAAPAVPPEQPGQPDRGGLNLTVLLIGALIAVLAVITAIASRRSGAKP